MHGNLLAQKTNDGERLTVQSVRLRNEPAGNCVGDCMNLHQTENIQTAPSITISEKQLTLVSDSVDAASNVACDATIATCKAEITRQHRNTLLGAEYQMVRRESYAACTT